MCGANSMALTNMSLMSAGSLELTKSVLGPLWSDFYLGANLVVENCDSPIRRHYFDDKGPMCGLDIQIHFGKCVYLKNRGRFGKKRVCVVCCLSIGSQHSVGSLFS